VEQAEDEVRWRGVVVVADSKLELRRPERKRSNEATIEIELVESGERRQRL
jgi:hypothetical protein